MGTEILSFGNLQNELEEARSSLKGVDESIKRLIGRDPSELPPRNIQKRPIEDKSKPLKIPGRVRNFTRENEEPPVKRRNHISVFKRLSDKVPDDNQHFPHKGLISKVIVTPKEIPSREQALEAQNKDEQFRARNKRMFGALLGTLQKFQQEETKLKQREQKRAELEKKIEEHEIKEKEEVRKERQELFFNRKKKQAEIKVIELKMLRMKEYSTWEQTQKPRLNYILTKAKPPIYYQPRKMTEQTKKLLEESNKNLQDILDAKKKQITEELQHIEEKMKKNFDFKFGIKEEKEEEHMGRDSRRHDNDDKDNDNDEPLDEVHDSQHEEIDNKKATETDHNEIDHNEIDHNEIDHNEIDHNEIKELEQQNEGQENTVNENSVEVPLEIETETPNVSQLTETVVSVTEDTSAVSDSTTCAIEYPVSVSPSFNNPDTDVNHTVTNYQYTEFQADYNLPEYNSQEFQNDDFPNNAYQNNEFQNDEYQNNEYQNNYNNISVQLGNFGPQTSD